jgi:anti-sigma factor RsiW
MNCPEARSLLSASRDGPPPPGADALSAHLAACPGCRRLQEDLRAGFASWTESARSVAVPAADEMWRDVRSALHRGSTPVRPAWVRVGLPLAAAAAVAVLLVQSPWRQASNTTESHLAQVNFVVPGTPGASTLVYEDSESGWLVVWTAENEPI